MESKAKMGRPKLLTLKLFLASVGSGESQYVSWALVPNLALRELLIGEGLNQLLEVMEYGLTKINGVPSRDIRPALLGIAKLLINRASPIRAVVEFLMQRRMEIEIYFSNAHIIKFFSTGKVDKWAEDEFDNIHNNSEEAQTRDAWMFLWHTMQQLDAEVCYNPEADKEFSAFFTQLKGAVKEAKKGLNKNTKLRRKQK